MIRSSYRTDGGASCDRIRRTSWTISNRKSNGSSRRGRMRRSRSRHMPRACLRLWAADTRLGRRSLATVSQVPAHTKAPEGTGGDLRSTGPEATNKSAVPGRRRVPRSPALRPANLVPGTVPRITPRTGLAVQPAPSGKTKCTVGTPVTTTGLSTNLQRIDRKLSPNLMPLWTVCGYTRRGGTACVVCLLRSSQPRMERCTS